MVIPNIITGLVNFFSFLSLSATTGSETGFLAASFILSASLLLEGLSLKNDYLHTVSGIISSSKFILYLISSLSATFSIAGLAKFVDVYFEGQWPIHLMVASFPDSIYYLSSTDINIVFYVFWIVGSCIPLFLAFRELILQTFRMKHYNLEQGLFGKVRD